MNVLNSEPGRPLRNYGYRIQKLSPRIQKQSCRIQKLLSRIQKLLCRILKLPGRSQNSGWLAQGCFKFRLGLIRLASGFDMKFWFKVGLATLCLGFPSVWVRLAVGLV